MAYQSSRPKAKIHPTCKVHKLVSKVDCPQHPSQLLAQVLRHVLRQAVQTSGTNYLHKALALPWEGLALQRLVQGVSPSSSEALPEPLEDTIVALQAQPLAPLALKPLKVKVQLELAVLADIPLVEVPG